MSVLNKLKEFFGFVETEPFAIGESEEEVPQSVSRTRHVKMAGPAMKQRQGHIKINVVEPKIYEDSLGIATDLRENSPVIVSLKYLDQETGKRLIDFVCGTAYAINGNMMKIGENIFLFTPPCVTIVDSNDKTTFEQGVEQEEKEVFFKKA